MVGVRQHAIITMDSIITFPPPGPDLRLSRPPTAKWAATLAEERLRFQEDQEAMRVREENLREYEARLRLLQAEIEAGRSGSPATPVPPVARSTPAPFQRPSSRAPFSDDPALASAWEKLHRAREILEAEQRNLRDDRISIHELEIMVKQRAEEVAEREARLAQREALVTAAAAPTPESKEEPVSRVTRITRAPFDMARSVFGGKKAV
jgi:hypothetical protein